MAIRSFRTAAALVCLAGLITACSPDIAPGTYFCGPEKLCPPDLICHEPTFVCESAFDAEPFLCPEGTELAEPDNELATARNLPVSCGNTVLSAENGCLVSDETVDLFALDMPASCAGTAPRLELQIRYPVAFRPLRLELLDANGVVLATSTLCTPELESAGTDWQCLSYAPTEAVLYVRVGPDPEGPNCDGACDYNQYWLSITHKLS